MKMTESNRIEFKRELTDELDIEKEVVALTMIQNKINDNGKNAYY